MKVAELTVTGGSYTLDANGDSVDDGSSYTIFAKMTDVINDFWYVDANGDGIPETDIYDDLLGQEVVLAYTHGDTDPQNTTITGGPINPDGTLAGPLNVVSTHNSSFEINIVPEPTTMFFFGFGLLGLAGVVRRRD